MSDLKKGDVVLLKSGGPAMTIRFIDGVYVTCDWFDDNKPMEKTFEITSLKGYEQPTAGIF